MMRCSIVISIISPLLFSSSFLPLPSSSSTSRPFSHPPSLPLPFSIPPISSSSLFTSPPPPFYPLSPFISLHFLYLSPPPHSPPPHSPHFSPLSSPLLPPFSLLPHQVHAYIIHYLKKQMPYMIGKSEKQKKLLDRLDR